MPLKQRNKRKIKYKFYCKSMQKIKRLLEQKLMIWKTESYKSKNKKKKFKSKKNNWKNRKKK